jgi:hypothetical protein
MYPELAQYTLFHPLPLSRDLTLLSYIHQGIASGRFQNLSLSKFCTERRDSAVSTLDLNSEVLSLNIGTKAGYRD